VPQLKQSFGQGALSDSDGHQPHLNLHRWLRSNFSWHWNRFYFLSQVLNHVDYFGDALRRRPVFWEKIEDTHGTNALNQAESAG